MVGKRGFEPPAPASRRQCSTRLSYSPTESARHPGRGERLAGGAPIPRSRRACKRVGARSSLPAACVEQRVDAGEFLAWRAVARNSPRSEEHTSELQSLMRISYADFCLKKKNPQIKKSHLLYSKTYANNHWQQIRLSTR